MARAGGRGMNVETDDLAALRDVPRAIEGVFYFAEELHHLGAALEE